jgi:very-short-patch-repair endonuclease
MLVLQALEGGAHMEALFKQLSGLIIPIVFLIVVLLAIAALKRYVHGPSARSSDIEDLPYALRRAVMSPAERSFLGILEEVVDASQYYVFPQTPLASLVYVPRGNGSYLRHENRIRSKVVDFVLCTKDAVAPVLVIELDDSSHERDDRQERDAFVDSVMNKVRLPILHVKARRDYDPRTLAADASKAIAASAQDQRVTLDM